MKRDFLYKTQTGLSPAKDYQDFCSIDQESRAQ